MHQFSNRTLPGHHTITKAWHKHGIPEIKLPAVLISIILPTTLLVVLFWSATMALYVADKVMGREGLAGNVYHDPVAQAGSEADGDKHDEVKEDEGERRAEADNIAGDTLDRRASRRDWPAMDYPGQWEAQLRNREKRKREYRAYRMKPRRGPAAARAKADEEAVPLLGPRQPADQEGPTPSGVNKCRKKTSIGKLFKGILRRNSKSYPNKCVRFADSVKSGVEDETKPKYLSRRKQRKGSTGKYLMSGALSPLDCGKPRVVGSEWDELMKKDDMIISGDVEDVISSIKKNDSMQEKSSEGKKIWNPVHRDDGTEHLTLQRTEMNRALNDATACEPLLGSSNQFDTERHDHFPGTLEYRHRERRKAWSCMDLKGCITLFRLSWESRSAKAT